MNDFADLSEGGAAEKKEAAAQAIDETHEIESETQPKECSEIFNRLHTCVTTLTISIGDLETYMKKREEDFKVQMQNLKLDFQAEMRKREEAFEKRMSERDQAWQLKMLE